MAKLTGQEALDYIRSGGGYKVINDGGLGVSDNIPQPQKGNFFVNLLKGIVADPFAKLSEGTGSLTNKILNAVYDGPEVGYAPLTRGILDEKAIQQAKDNPLLSIGKGAAGIGALAIPGSIGGGFKGAIGSGAMGGSLGGFGASEGEDLISSLGDAGKGAAFGGVAGGALYGAGQAIGGIGERLQGSTKKLNKVADDLDDKVLVKKYGVKPRNNKTEGGVFKKIRKLDLAGTKDADELLAATDDVLLNNGKTVREYIGSLPEGNLPLTSKDEILSPLQELIDNPGITKSDRQAITNLADDLRSAYQGKDVLDPSELYALKTYIGKQRNFNRAANDLTRADLLDRVYWKADGLLDDSLKATGFEDFKALNEVVSNALDVQSYAQRASSNIDATQLMSLSDWTSMIVSPAATLANRFMKNPGGISMVGRGLRNVAGAVDGGIPGSGILEALTGQSGRIGAGIGLASSTSRPEDAQAVRQDIGASGLDPLMQLSQPDPEQLTAQMTLELMMQGLDLRDAAQLAELTVMAQYGSGGGSGEGGAKMTEAEALYSNAAKAAERAYATLQGNPDVAGRAAGVSNFFSGITNTATPKTEYAAQIEAMGSFIRRAFLGSGQTDTELAKLEPFIPKVTDSPERAAQKFEQIIPLLQSYGQAGY